MTEILTLPATMSRGISPRWYAREGYVAHLLSGGESRVPGTVQTLCHMSERVSELHDAEPWDRRCAQCKEKITKAFEAVTAPPPAFVRETLTVVVVRPANAQETAAATAKRKLGQMKSWHSIDITVDSMEAISTPAEPVEDDRVIHSGTAEEPTIITADEQGKLSQEAISVLKHVHTEDGVCVKNRFGHRCSA